MDEFIEKLIWYFRNRSNTLIALGVFLIGIGLGMIIGMSGCGSQTVTIERGTITTDNAIDLGLGYRNQELISNTVVKTKTVQSSGEYIFCSLFKFRDPFRKPIPHFVKEQRGDYVKYVFRHGAGAGGELVGKVDSIGERISCEEAVKYLDEEK